MKMHFKINLNKVFIFVVILMTNTASSEVIEYAVKKGESLSNILYYKLGCSPVYGPNGFLKQVLEKNPKLVGKDGNQVQHGEVIVIQKNCGRKIAEENRSSEKLLPARSPSKKAESEKNEGAVETQIWYSYFKLAPQVSVLSIEGKYKDQYRHSSLSSESANNPGIKADWGYYNSDGLGIFFQTEFSQVNFYADPDIDVQNLHPVRQSYALGASFRTDVKTQIIMKAALSDKIFLNAPDVSTVKIEKVSLPELSFGITRNIVQKERFAIEAGITGKAILPRKAGVIDGDFGFGTEAELSLKLRNKGLRLFYSYTDQRSTLNDTTVTEMGLSLVFSMSFLEQ